jgi:hypothetical protein
MASKMRVESARIEVGILGVGPFSGPKGSFSIVCGPKLSVAIPIMMCVQVPFLKRFEVDEKLTHRPDVDNGASDELQILLVGTEGPNTTTRVTHISRETTDDR